MFKAVYIPQQQKAPTGKNQVKEQMHHFLPLSYWSFSC